ncbi:hypothetical protein P3X46_005282 [Hevea brasiliensis]|uniref:NB-ARC domain-containing protein n=1 Tax=Hevea brasiliensis TaxID=3981 RepID=A0ABQ9N1U9_HEVBR|nr:hypothetical protein P3X46_005282 [Hevea brasiliensis]
MGDGNPNLSGIIRIVSSILLDPSISLIKDKYHLFKGVKEQVEKLSSNLSAIEAVLQIAEQKQLEESHYRDWLRKLQGAVWDAEDVLDTFRTDAFLWKRKQEVLCFHPPFSLSKTSYKYDAALRIKEVSSKLGRIADERKNFSLEFNVDGGNARKDTPICLSLETEFFGRADDKERIVNLLISDESEKQGKVSLIPIVGMGGIGKTTLARVVYNDSRVEKHFEFRMWVYVSPHFNLTQILREMMESYSKTSLPSNLSSSLVESQFRAFLPGKRFFLVLDDVWSVDYNKDWEPLLQFLEMGEKGSKVLLTTRNEKVAEIACTKSPHILECLPEYECWSLFNNGFRSGNMSSLVQEQLEDVGKKIVRRCDGLPLAVKAMRNLLRGNVEKSKWQKVMNSSTRELEDSYSLNILPTLKLSYNHLPSHLKQCFAICSIFPKAYAFYKEELVKLWMAQGFVQSSQLDRAEKIGIEYFDELLARSFFQVLNIDGKVQYRMHDFIHDLAQSVSSTYCCQVKDFRSSSFSEEHRHMSLLCHDVEQSLLKIVDSSSKLRTLLLPGDHVKDFGQALGKVFHSLKYIRMLDLSSSLILELPSSIEEMKLLRYLDISKTEIKVLPDSICNLSNIQTLKLLGCPRLFALPKDLRKLVNLHYLELDEIFWFHCKALPPGMGKLTNLHNLSAFQVGCKTGYGIEELKDMAYLRGTLHISMLENAVNAKEARLSEKESLQKLIFEWSNGDFSSYDEAAEERILEDLLPHSNIKELQLWNYKGTRFPTWMRDGLLQNLVTAALKHCTKSITLTLGQLPLLEALNVKGLQELEAWPNMQYPSLRRLKICDCPKLRKLPDIFDKLEILTIKKCNALKVLPVTPSLESLVFVDNPSLEDWNEVTVSEGERFSLSKLAELKIVNCPKLKGLPQNFSPQKLEISNCELLTTLPSTEHAQNLQCLALDSYSDGTLLRAVPNTSSLYSLIISNIENLVSFPKWPHLPELKALYIHSCKELMSLSQDERPLRSLSSLKLLSIKECPKLVKLPAEGLPSSLECLSINSCAGLKSLVPKDILKSLTSLKDLYIQDCPLIDSFPEDGLPESLQHLHIKDCPLLTKRCQRENGVGPEWPKIMHISDLEIDSTKISTSHSAPWYCHFICGGG